MANPFICGSRPIVNSFGSAPGSEHTWYARHISWDVWTDLSLKLHMKISKWSNRKEHLRSPKKTRIRKKKLIKSGGTAVDFSLKLVRFGPTSSFSAFRSADRMALEDTKGQILRTWHGVLHRMKQTITIKIMKGHKNQWEFREWKQGTCTFCTSSAASFECLRRLSFPLASHRHCELPASAFIYHHPPSSTIISQQFWDVLGCHSSGSAKGSVVPRLLRKENPQLGRLQGWTGICLALPPQSRWRKSASKKRRKHMKKWWINVESLLRIS